VVAIILIGRKGLSGEVKSILGGRNQEEGREEYKKENDANERNSTSSFA
jgi:hypothetical protein